VRSELVGSALWVPGTVISRADARVAAEVPGMLSEVAEVGTRVAQGDTLARLNDRELRLQLALDTAELERHKARLEYLGRQVDRIAQLARTNTSAEAELDQLRAERDMLAQELAASATARERTLYDIERTRIAAPFPGVVVERLANPGEYLERGMAVVRLVNIDSLEIRAQAPIESLRSVRPGDVLQVRNGLTVAETRVRSVVPVGDRISRMLELRLALEGPDWVVGEPVRVAISQGRPVAALTVPRDALVLREGATFLYKITPDNIARRVDVVTGEGVGDRIVVQGDLHHGERVIIRGAERLQDGHPVRLL
jgi:RND family efflux transporter MFP subunit